MRRRAVSRVPRLAALGRPRARLGIDIGSSQIKVVVAFVYEGRIFVEHALCFGTPEGAVAGYVVQDTAAVAAAIRSALDVAGVSERATVACVPAPAAMIKRFNLSMAETDDIESVVHAEVENLSPVGSDSLCVDYQVLERADEAGLEVLVAAARSEVVCSYVRVVEAAGLVAEAVDVDSLALTNMFATSCRLEAARTVALIHVGARFSLVIIHSHGRPAVTGDVPVGTACHADEGGDVVECRLTPDFDPEAPTPAPSAPHWRDHAAAEIDSALRFYWPASAGDRLDEILLSGGAAWEPEFLQSLSERTGVQVRSVDPFHQMKRRFERHDRDGSVCAAQFGVATGLALHALELP
jgi:type IV pilus assembly protein PilM